MASPDTDILSTVVTKLGSVRAAAQTQFNYDIDRCLASQVNGYGSTEGTTTYTFNAQGQVTDDTTAYGASEAETTH